MHADQPTALFDPVAQLGDDALIAATHRLLREERELSARLLLYLAEVDARQLYRQHAYSSMFEYCMQALHLSESEDRGRHDGPAMDNLVVRHVAAASGDRATRERGPR